MNLDYTIAGMCCVKVSVYDVDLSTLHQDAVKGALLSAGIGYSQSEADTLVISLAFDMPASQTLLDVLRKLVAISTQVFCRLCAQHPSTR